MNRSKKAKSNAKFFKNQTLRKSDCMFGLGVITFIQEMERIKKEREALKEKVITSDMLISSSGRKLGGVAKKARIRSLEKEGYINALNL